MRAREPAAFWRENLVAVDILPRVLARMSCQRTQVISVLVFVILRLGNTLTSFNQDNSANFFGEKNGQSSYPGCLLFENTRTNFTLNLVLVVVLVLESKALHLHTP